MIAIYPGSFDPPTKGHMDIITRASSMADKLIVAVANNPAKKDFFTIHERMHYLKDCTQHFNNIEVTSFTGLLVDFFRHSQADCIIRGLRNVAEYEHELGYALANKLLEPTAETLFIPASAVHSVISSSFVKEIALLGGDFSAFAPERLVEAIRLRAREIM